MESSPQPTSSVVADYCSRGFLQYCSPSSLTTYYLEPTPPLFTDDDSSSRSRISPVIIGLISVLAAAFLLLSCYIFVYIYCKRRRGSWLSLNLEGDDIAAAASLAPPSPNSNGGLDEQFISSLTMFNYRRGDGLVGSSTDCAICLTEFIEEESLKIMTNCQHAFHLPCIDIWLRSHSNCPMCRASVMAARPPPPIRGLPLTVSRMIFRVAKTLLLWWTEVAEIGLGN